jgi:hypothetical protein
MLVVGECDKICQSLPADFAERVPRVLRHYGRTTVEGEAVTVR